MPDADADAGTIAMDGEAKAMRDWVASEDEQAYKDTMNTILATALVSLAEDNRTYWYAINDANTTLGNSMTVLEESQADGLGADLDSWNQQNDNLLGIDEKAVGAALATQDKLDRAARDDADATAANQAAIEVGKDAVAEQGFEDADAGYQKTQDVNDALDQQTFEETVSNNYANELQSWADSVGNGLSAVPLAASATEQYQQALADAQWVESVTTAEVNDVEQEDTAQVSWAQQIDLASEQQTSEDANAMAQAIVAGDNADKQHAADVDAAWTSEVQGMADAITSYDQANSAATAKRAASDAAATHVARDVYDKARGAYFKSWVDIMTNVTKGTEAADHVLPDLLAAETTMRAAQWGAYLTWENTCAGDEQTYVQTLADAKAGTPDHPETGWVAGITNAEAGYISAAATAGAVATKSDALAAATAEGALAVDSANMKIAIAQANTQLVSNEGAADKSRVHAEAGADATDIVAYAQADATYQEAIQTNFANSLSQAASNSPSSLANYYAAVEQDRAEELPFDEAHVVAEVGKITQADVPLSDGIELDSVVKANSAASAVELQTSTFAPQDANAKKQSADNVAQATGADADAQAAYKTSVAGAMAGFYQDKALASRGFDYALAAAGVAEIATGEPNLMDYENGLITADQLAADTAGMIAAYQSAWRAAREAQLSGYGDAEINEAKKIGQAQIALATAEGSDETTLVGRQTNVANMLAAEGAQADETLVHSVSSANAAQAAGIAGDVADWTESAGTAEEEAVQGLGGDEIALAGKLAGAEADYAIAGAETQATLAASLAQGTTDGTTAFDALYAEGYVQWLTDLKPSFVDNATTIAADDAQHRESLEAVVVQLANAHATAESSFVSSSGTTATQGADARASADNGYQVNQSSGVGQVAIGATQADSIRKVGLAQAAGVYVLADAQADKNAAVNEFDGVANWKELYVKELADATLTLTDSQADADLSWIKGVAQANESFQINDATNWKSMIDSEAQAGDQFAHQNNAATQTEADATVQAAADTMVPRAKAEQAQANGDAAAAGAFRIAQANATATVWNWLAAQLGTPWAQSQAGLAAAESNWATTAAALYENYVSQLGTNMVHYATSDSDQFLSEMTTIDAVDRADSDKLADAQQALTETLAADEATFEQTIAPANMNYQFGLAQTDHDYRYAVAQAEHDLKVNGDAAAYAAAMALANANRSDGRDEAASAFETVVDPAVAQQAIDDADATFLEAKSEADAVLDDTLVGNQAVHDYAWAEAADTNIKQKPDAQALHDYQVGDANGHAAAIASFDQANPSPWGDLAAWQAAAQAQQQTSDADAQLTLSNAEADAQESATQAQADAQRTMDDADAQAQHDETVASAQATHDLQLWQSDVTDAVFALLPDPLVAPADGPAPALTKDFLTGYEANDFYLMQNSGNFLDVVGSGPGMELFFGPPSFMPDDLGVSGPIPYDWGGWGGLMPWGLLGDASGSWTPDPSDLTGANSVVAAGGNVSGNYIPFLLRDMVRAYLPDSGVYQQAEHLSDGNAELIQLADASDDQGWLQWFFLGKNNPRSNGGPSAGGGIGASNDISNNPDEQTLNKINQRGRMTAGSSLVIGNQNIKNSIKYGDFQKAIYEGIADALEDQIWNLATAGILGEAEGELVQAAATKATRFGRDVIVLTIGKLTQLVKPEQVENIQKILKDRGFAHGIDDVVKQVNGFAQSQLRHAVDDVVEKMCFAPDTLVSTAEGLRPIGEVQIGDQVFAYDFATGEWVLAEVLKRHDNMYSGLIYTIVAGDSRIDVTVNHPIWVVDGADLAGRSVPRDLKIGEDEGSMLAGRWVNSQEVQAGDMLIGRNGELVRVTDVEPRFEESFAVSNLSIRTYHSFAVGPDRFLVHNGTPWCTTLEKWLDKPKDLVDFVQKHGLQLHANHIVMRHPQTYFDAKTRKALADSQDLLRKAGVELFDISADDFKARANKGNIQNFAWAINNYKDIHQKEYVMEVYRRLQEAWNTDRKAGVRAALEKMREELHNGNVFWNK